MKLTGRSRSHEPVSKSNPVLANVREALTIIPAEDVHTVLETALCEKPIPKPQA